MYIMQGFIQDFFARGGGDYRFYVFLNMYSLLCFPLVLLLSFIWIDLLGNKAK